MPFKQVLAGNLYLQLKRGRTMTEQVLSKYYLDKGINCAESMLRAAAESYGLDLDESNYMALCGFGGGVSCHHLCGGIIGGVAAICTILNHGDEESMKRAKEATVTFFDAAKESLGSEMCVDIMKDWRSEDIRCYKAVKKLTEILDETLAKYK